MSGWDARFDRQDYLFGTEPAAFLTAHRGLVPEAARTLCVAEGEGRNAVWLAQQGCTVTAFDASRTGLAKARRLAQARGQSIDFIHSGVEDWDWSPTYDLVVAIFIQFADPALRATIFAGLKRAVAPGGRLMLHGYTPGQVDLATGGPPHRENMYDTAMLRSAFGHMRILRLAEYEATISEGTGHHGRSALIDLIADRV